MNSRIAFAAALLAAAPAAAQVPFPTRSLGMGGAYIGVARGQDALFLNPANLGLADNPARSLGAMQVVFGGTVLGPEFSDLWEVANFDDVGDERAREILNSMSAGYIESDLDVRIPMVAYQKGPWAAGIGYARVNRTSIGRDILDLLFLGYEDGRTDYRTGNTTSDDASLWDIAVARGARFGALSVGATAHYLRGTSVNRARAYEPVYSDQAPQIEVDVVSATAGSGNGLSLDLGAALQPVPQLTISGAVRNAVGGIRWSDERHFRNLALNESNIRIDPPELRALFAKSQQDLTCPAPADDRQRQRACEQAEGLVDGVQLPRTAEAGAALILPWGTSVSAAFRSNLGDGELGGWWDTLASAGIEQRLWFLRVRAGVASNLQDGDAAGNLLSGGVSLGALHLSVARVEAGRTDGSDRAGYIGSIGLSTAITAKERPWRQ